MDQHGYNPIVILASSEMAPIGTAVAEKLKSKDERYSYLDLEYKTFPNREVAVRIPETIRSKEAYFFHSLHHPDPNTSLIKLLLTNNAIQLASVKSLVLVIPFIPYLRQDRKDQPRVPISARVIADLIETNRAVKRIITMDMHVEQEEGFFSIPVDNLRGRVLHAEYIKRVFKNELRKCLIVAPDFGAAIRTRRFAKLLGETIPVGILEKERSAAGKPTTLEFIGPSPKGKHVILYDDMIDTGGTIIAGAAALKKRGAKDVSICVTHGIFSPTEEGTAEEKFAKAGFHVIITGSIPRSKEYQKKNASWLTILPIERLLVKVLDQSERHGGSVSALS